MEITLAQFLENRLLALQMEDSSASKIQIFTKGGYYTDIYIDSGNPHWDDKILAEFINAGKTCVMKINDVDENAEVLKFLKENSGSMGISFDDNVAQGPRYFSPKVYRVGVSGLQNFIEKLEEFYWPLIKY